MKYTRLGKTGFDISMVAYGGIVSAMHYERTTYPGDGQGASDGYVAWAIDQGVNYFDVAPTYGDAQLMLGNSLRPYRDRVFLACKTGLRTSAEARPQMEESLRLLHTDHFDIYQMHALCTLEDVDIAFGPGGVMEMMRDMKEKGTTRKLGFTAHSEDVALKALSLYDFDSVLFPFNWHMNMAHGMGNALREYAHAHDIGLLCMKSMIERAWTDEERYASKYTKSWCRPIDADDERPLLLAAVKYALSLGVDSIVPPGNFDHFRFAVENIDRAVDEPLNDAERALLEKRLTEVCDKPFFDADCYTL